MTTLSFTDQLKAFADKTKAHVDKVIVASMLDFTSRVEDRTPVITGFLRANWQFTIDAPAKGTVDVGASALKANLPPGLAEAVPEDPRGRAYFLVNNASYARRIEYGFTGKDSRGRSYDQSGRGMVGLTVLEWPDIVRRASNAVGQAKL